MRVKNRLSALKVMAVKKPGKYADGGGLYLHVRSRESRSWAFRYMKDHRAHEMGLGSYPDVSLALAREKAAEQRKTETEGDAATPDP